MPPTDGWAQERSAAAEEHLSRLRARQESDRKRAAALLTRFAAAARAAGLTPERLRVRGYSPTRSARTPLLGWYLRSDRKAALDVDGRFYLLSAPLTLLDSLRGVTPAPSAPPLVLGAGGRDGDSVELRVALDRLLPGWDDAREF